MFEHTETHALYKRPSLTIGGERHELSLGLFRVGRDPQNNLVLEDSALSRHHFAIDVQAHQAQLIDLGSANGTLVNKKRVRSAWLKDGDLIKIGDQVLVFEAPGFILSHAIFDDVEQTHLKKVSKATQLSWVALLALLVSTASLFMQLVNRERQIEQDAFLHHLQASFVKPVAPTEPKVALETETAAQKWQKAVNDFKSGDEDQACSNIKGLIPELDPSDLLRTKAQSFYERKCVL
ncbi:MAG: FHA domain-containing protein [Myxococcota bacterium]